VRLPTQFFTALEGWSEMPNLRFEVGRCVNLAFHKTRPFFLLTSVVVVISLFEAYQVGVIRGFRDWIGQESYGRVLFAVGAAITQMQHGGYGFSISSVIETILTYGGITADNAILEKLGTKFPNNLQNTALINAAIDKAVQFSWPFNPGADVRGSGGDDIGFVDYARLAFQLFGYKIQSLYYIYFSVLAFSAAAYLYQFRTRNGILPLLAITCAVLVFVFESNFFDPIYPRLITEPSSISVADPRFLSGLAIIPGFHLACIMLGRLRPSQANIAIAVVQSVVLVFALLIRVSAIWTVLSIVTLAILIGLSDVSRQRFGFIRFWSVAVLLAVWAVHATYVLVTLHPVYHGKGEISHHVFWHAVFYQLQFHPQWNQKYSAQFDNAQYDELPPVAAKKYLLRNPPPDPEAVYLTPDHKYLTYAAAEIYIRKAFFEFMYRDPRFVFDSIFVYNPLRMYTILKDYLSSWNRVSSVTYLLVTAYLVAAAGFLSVSSDEYRLFARVTLFVSCAFLLSLAPICITVVDVRTMADQFTMLLIAIVSGVLLGLTTGLRIGAWALSFAQEWLTVRTGT
jgi:ABC-type multidrug transport system fused ATPase/permease subunit